MEILIGIIVALLGGVFYFKNKADEKSVESKLAAIKGQDKELEITEEELKAQIAEMDNNIKRIRKERKESKKNIKDLSLAERRKRIKEGLDNE